MRWYIMASSAGHSGISLFPWDLNWLCCYGEMQKNNGCEQLLGAHVSFPVQGQVSVCLQRSHGPHLGRIWFPYDVTIGLEQQSLTSRYMQAA